MLNLKKKYKTNSTTRHKDNKSVNIKLESMVAQYCTKFLSENAAQMIRSNFDTADSLKLPQPNKLQLNSSFFDNAQAPQDGKNLFRYSLKQTLNNFTYLLERTVFKKF